MAAGPKRTIPDPPVTRTLRPGAVWPALLVSLMIAIPARGVVAQSTLHVATWGSDTNDGTPSAPFRSIQQGVRVAKPGDTIVVHAGTYDGAVTLTTSGTTQRPITLQSAGDGAATLTSRLSRRSCAETSPAQDRTVEILDGVDNWVIKDLIIEGGIFISGTDRQTLADNVRNRSLPGRGLYDPEGARTTIPSLGADPADGIQILDSRIRGRGIHVVAAREGRIEGNEIHDIDCGIGAAIWLNRFSDGWTVRRNHIHDLAASEQHYMSEGIRLGSGSMYNLIEENIVERAGGPGRGIAADVHAGWNVIRRNRVSETDQGLSEQSAAWGNQWLENVSQNNRRFGFNIYGQSDGTLDPGTPSYLHVRCNVSVGNPVGLSVGAVTKSDFRNNDFDSVELTTKLRNQWGAAGNVWEGSASPPDPDPPPPALKDCSPGPPVKRTWGDVNLDGVVDGTDAAVVLNHVAGLPTPDADLTVGDVDGDSRVTARDALIVLHFTSGTDTGSSRVGTSAD